MAAHRGADQEPAVGASRSGGAVFPWLMLLVAALMTLTQDSSQIPMTMAIVLSAAAIVATLQQKRPNG